MTEPHYDYWDVIAIRLHMEAEEKIMRAQLDKMEEELGQRGQ